MTADDVRDYAQQSVANVTASNVGSIPEYDVDQVYGNISDVFNDHTDYNQDTDQTFADDLMSHSINQGRQNYTPYEQHLISPGILGRSSRAGLGIYPNALSAAGSSGVSARVPTCASSCPSPALRSMKGYLGGRREPLLYNTDSYYWYFGNDQRLTF